MIPCLIGACVVGGYILGASTMAFILGAHLKHTPPPFVVPDNANCRACIVVEAIKKQHAELCRAWHELEKR
jgi:hypothetical protein